MIELARQDGMRKAEYKYIQVMDAPTENEIEQVREAIRARFPFEIVKRQIDEFGLNPREREIVYLAGNFGGKIFSTTIKWTYYITHSTKNVENLLRIWRKKKKIFRRGVATGLLMPRRIYFLTKKGVEIASEICGKNVTIVEQSFHTVVHTVNEQITFACLRWIGREVEHPKDIEWRKRGIDYTPDLFYVTNSGKKVYVEIERNPKMPETYNKIFTKMEKNGADSILYVFPTEQVAKKGLKRMPEWEKIRVTTQKELWYSCFAEGKIRAHTQEEAIKKYKKEA